MTLKAAQLKTYTGSGGLDDDLQDLADDIALSLLDLTPDLTCSPDCLDVASEASAFFAQAGIDVNLCYGELETTEVGERVIITPHYWLEVPIQDTRLYVDLTLPYWLTDPESRETDWGIPTVLTERLSDNCGRRYTGRQIAFPSLVGDADSSALHLYPNCTFGEGMVRRYRELR